MSMDGERSKDIRQRKRPTERQEVGFNEKMMPKKRHPAVYTGMAFAVLGGLMITATFWSVGSADSGNALVGQLFVWDLQSRVGHDLLSRLAPIAGSLRHRSAPLANEKNRASKFAAIGVLASSVIAAIAISVLILLERAIHHRTDRPLDLWPAIFFPSSDAYCLSAASSRWTPKLSGRRGHCHGSRQ
jgi:hypothetical protein